MEQGYCGAQARPGDLKAPRRPVAVGAVPRWGARRARAEADVSRRRLAQRGGGRDADDQDAVASTIVDVPSSALPAPRVVDSQLSDALLRGLARQGGVAPAGRSSAADSHPRLCLALGTERLQHVSDGPKTAPHRRGRLTFLTAASGACSSRRRRSGRTSLLGRLSRQARARGTERVPEADIQAGPPLRCGQARGRHQRSERSRLRRFRFSGARRMLCMTGGGPSRKAWSRASQ